MRFQPKRDALIVTAAFTAILFAITLGWVLWGPGTVPAPLSAQGGTAAQSTVPYAQAALDGNAALWARDNGVTDLVAAPPSTYQLPTIPGGRRVWYRKSGAVESWGYVTEANATDAGLAVLDYYDSLGTWELGSSDTLDMRGSAWGGTVFRRDTKEVVTFVALPEKLGEPAGQANRTRVSVMRLAGEGALRSVLNLENFAR